MRKEGGRQGVERSAPGSIEGRPRAPLQQHRSRPLPSVSFGAQRRSGYSCARFKLHPPSPRGQAPLVVVSLQMVSTRFLPSAQLSISSAFASAKLGAQYWIRRTDQQMVYSKAQPSHYTGKLCHVLPLLILHGCYVCEL